MDLGATTEVSSMNKHCDRPGPVVRWFRKRMAKRIQKKLALTSEQTAELMPILGRLRHLHRRPDLAQMAALTDLLKTSEFDSTQLNEALSDWANQQVDAHRQSLDQRAQELANFVSGLGLDQRSKLATFISKPHCCGRGRCLA